MLRLLRLTLLVGVLAMLGVPTAHAYRLPDGPETVTSAHFEVHYNGQVDNEYRINVMQAHDIAAWAERAYAAYTSWGYTPPLDDGDGRNDIYVFAVQEVPEYLPVTWGVSWSDDPTAVTSSAYAWLDSHNGLDEHRVMHLVFQMFEAARWNQHDPWFTEGAAEWASLRVLGFPMSVNTFAAGESLPLTFFVPRTAIPLDCSVGLIPGRVEDAWGGEHCGDVAPEQNSYQAWPFLTYLGERYGTQIVKDVLDRGPATGDPNAASLDFLTQVVGTRGATLADIFNDWTVATMTGNYTAPGLKGTLPAPWASFPTGDTTKPGETTAVLDPLIVPVNHLSVRYVALPRGTPDATGPCYAATLTLNVAIPAGVQSRPHFLWPIKDAVPVPLAVNGSKATLSMPWETCETQMEGLLSLPNDSSAIDGTEFTVSGTLAVDKTTIATGTAPPEGAYDGPTVPVADLDPAPSIALYGPETVRLSKRAKTVRLVVFSSGQGQLEVELGSTLLGKRSLRAGNNDLRFTLPRGAARRLLAARNVLTVTSLSSTGTRGATITRKLVFTK